MEPLKTSHADKVTRVSGAPGFQVKRILSGYAYPQNGNVHNPTPNYTWQLLLDGRVVDTDTKRGPLLEAARKPGAVAAYSVCDVCEESGCLGVCHEGDGHSSCEC